MTKTERERRKWLKEMYLYKNYIPSDVSTEEWNYLKRVGRAERARLRRGGEPLYIREEDREEFFSACKKKLSANVGSTSE